jgi:hypothetical protein
MQIRNSYSVQTKRERLGYISMYGKVTLNCVSNNKQMLDCICVVEDRCQWLAALNSVMNLLSIKCGKCIKSNRLLAV